MGGVMSPDGFRVESPPLHAPGVRFATGQGRASWLEAVLAGDDLLLLCPERLLARLADLALTPTGAGLARTQGTGRLMLGPAAGGTVVLIRLAPGAAVLLARDAFLAATLPIDATQQGLDGEDDWLLLQASADRPAFVAISGLGGFARLTLGAGEALDVAACSLLIVDGGVDLAIGTHLDVPGDLSFVQCLGAGGIGVRAG